MSTREPERAGPCVVVAGGGTAGHIEPALSVADAVLRRRPDARVVALGTRRGLEGTLVPDRGYPLELIPPVPLPRKPSADLLRLPLRMRGAVRDTREVLNRVGADVVVGFGGYVALPAYLAARGRLPVIVHDSNVRPGLANKIGARFASRVAVATEGTGLGGAEVVGIPLRRTITTLDRAALRSRAREHFGLDPDAPTLLVFGGSQGARTVNSAVSAAAGRLAEAGVGVLHAHGPKNTIEVARVPGAPAYVPVPYLRRMDLAYAAADMVLCRSGAMTVAEVSVLGLPAVFVPLPHGNGEQELNARPVVEAGGAVLVPDAELTAEKIATEVIPLLTDPGRVAAMSDNAVRGARPDADEALAAMALEAIRR